MLSNLLDMDAMLEPRLCLRCQFYLQDPERNATGTTVEQRKLIIGGEASTWGDCISAESFDVMTWPAASSVAEVRIRAAQGHLYVASGLQLHADR